MTLLHGITNPSTDIYLFKNIVSYASLEKMLKSEFKVNALSYCYACLVNHSVYLYVFIYTDAAAYFINTDGHNVSCWPAEGALGH